MQSDENNLTNTTFLTSQKRKRSRQSKYEKLDYILGASNELPYGIKKGRYIQYTKSDVHSLDNLMGKIQEGQDKNNLVYDILATIPYKDVGLSTNPSENEINVICRNVVKSISEITGLNFISSHNNRQKNSDTLTSKIFKCSQDKKTRREDKNYLKPSYIKHFDCESKLKFSIKSGYNFITITIQHKKHHPTQKTLPIPQDLEDFIKQQACDCFGDLYSAVKNSGKFTEYINQSSTKPRKVIKDIWMEHFASKWKKDENAKISCHKLLASGELSHIKELPLVDNPDPRTIWGQCIAFSFEYQGIDKTMFSSAAIDGTFNVTTTLQQGHVIVGEFKGEGYPLAALFGPRNGISEFVIQTFLQKTIDLGYKFQYITSDMDGRNLVAIGNCIGKINTQICLWHLKKAIVGKLCNQKNKKTKEEKYLYIKEECPWFDCELFDNLDASVVGNEYTTKNITEKTAAIITRAARDSPLFYASRVRSNDTSNIKIHYNETPFGIYQRMLKEVYDYVLVENKKIRYFQYLYTNYLKPEQFMQWSRAYKAYIPRMTNMLVESFFKSLKHDHLKKKRVLRLDTVLYILNEKIKNHYEPTLKLRIQPVQTGRDLVNNLPVWKKKMTSEIKRLLKEDQSTQESEEYRVDMDLWTCTCGQQKFSPYFLCRHLVLYAVAQLGNDKLNLLSYLCERRTTVPLLINKEFVYENIHSIDNVLLSDILEPLKRLPNISKENEYIENEMNNPLELGNVEISSNYESELSEVSQSDDNYYEDSSEDENEDPLYGVSKKLHYLSSILLENKNIRETFLSGRENSRAMTDLVNRLDEILEVARLYRNGTMDTCNTNTPPPGLAINYTDWIRYQKYDGEIIKNIRL